jgi:hypothetical protein
MNYTYELKLEQITQTIKQKKFIVHEFEDEISIICHSVNFIIMKKKSENFYGTELERMYNWLKVNHPEFLI